MLLKDLLTIKYGKEQSKVVSQKGYPIYGTGGIIGYANSFIYNKPSILIGRKGSIETIRYINVPFWCVDTTFYTIINEKIVIPRYLFYKLSTINFKQFDEGTTIPSLRSDTLNQISIHIHQMIDQQHIVDTIGSIDGLIEQKEIENKKINQLIQLIFIKNTKQKDKIRIGDLNGYKIIKSGIEKFDSQKIYLDTASVDKYGISSRDYLITNDNKPSRANMRPIPKSVWFAKLKDSPKYLFVQDYMNEILNNYIFSTGFLGLEGDTRFIANYLYALITSDDFETQKNSLSIGATMQGINNDSFKEILVPNITVDEMNEIGEALDNLLVEIYNNNLKIKHLSELKQLYLKKFFG